MNLLEKIKLLQKNQEQKAKLNKMDKIYNKYKELKILYDEVENSLKHGDIRILVHGWNEKEVADKYFTDRCIACCEIYITDYSYKITERGIRKLEKDYKKIKEVYEKYE